MCLVKFSAAAPIDSIFSDAWWSAGSHLHLLSQRIQVSIAASSTLNLCNHPPQFFLCDLYILAFSDSLADLRQSTFSPLTC